MKKYALLISAGSFLGIFGCGSGDFWSTVYLWFDIGSTILQDAAALNIV